MPGGVSTDGLPPGWAWATLGDLIDRGEYGTSVKCNYASRGAPVLRIPNISNGRVTLEDMKFATSEVGYDPADFLRPGDLLVCRTNGSVNLIGRSARVRTSFSTPTAFASYLLRFRFRECDSLPSWVDLYLNSREARSFIERNAASSAGQHNISLSLMRTLPLRIPPLSEQRRIVGKVEELFSDLDAGVAALERARANLKKYRAAVLKAAVEGRLTADWRAAHPDTEPASDLLARILADRRKKWEADQLAKAAAAGKSPPKNWQAKYAEPVPLDNIDPLLPPDGWCVASLDQVSQVITSGSRDWSQFYGQGSGTFLMAQNIRPGQLDLSFRQVVGPPQDDRDRARSQVAQDDLLITIVGANTGDVCRVPNELPEHFVCQSVALLRLVRPEYARYVELYLVSDQNGQRQFRRYIYGAGRPHLSFDQLRMTAVTIPPLAEQEQIVAEVEARLSQVAAAERQIDANLTRAARLRQAILKRVFAGQIVPQVPADEPAPVLLKRIRTGIETAAVRRERGQTRKQSSRPRRDL